MSRHLTAAAVVAALAVLAAACSSSPSSHTSTTRSTGAAATTTTTKASTTTSTTAASGSTTTSATGALPTITMGTFTGIKPTTLILSGDAGNVVTHVTWSTWGTQSATGSGSWGYNDCTPTCAQGTVTQYPATLVFSKPANGQFTLLTETTTGPYGFTHSFTLPTTTYSAQ